MKNKSDIILRRTKRIRVTYFCETNGQFGDSYPLPDNVVTDDDAYKYAYDCEKKLLLHHKEYPYCVFERRFFYQLLDGVVVAKNGDETDTFVKYNRETGNIFVNGELTNLYKFLKSEYFKTMSLEGKDVFFRFLKNRFNIDLNKVYISFVFPDALIRFVVFKHETVDAYNDYHKFKRGDIYKPFGLSEDKL